MQVQVYERLGHRVMLFTVAVTIRFIMTIRGSVRKIFLDWVTANSRLSKLLRLNLEIRLAHPGPDQQALYARRCPQPGVSSSLPMNNRG